MAGNFATEIGGAEWSPDNLKTWMKDPDGTPFDDRDYAGTDSFLALDPVVSFPYTPIFPNAGDSTAKHPVWSNNPINYHNRGDSTFVGENSLYGDFSGLDGNFTEHPDLVDGFTEAASSAWAMNCSRHCLVQPMMSWCPT